MPPSGCVHSTSNGCRSKRKPAPGSCRRQRGLTDTGLRCWCAAAGDKIAATRNRVKL